MTVIVDDDFYCSQAEIEAFKETRVWREMRSWIAKRREGVADLMDAANGELEFKALQRERQVLRDLLELPDLIIATLDVKAANEQIEETEDASIGTDRTAPD
jgi:deoxyribodipyrimidine photolyase-like uncharacterized protein